MASNPRVTLVDWFGWLTAIAAVCGVWKLLFPPSGSHWPMDLLMAVVIPSATIAVARRAGLLRGWCFSVVTTTALFGAYFLFNGHRTPTGIHSFWWALADAVWLGLMIGTFTWAMVASVTGLFSQAGRWRGTWARHRTSSP